MLRVKRLLASLKRNSLRVQMVFFNLIITIIPFMIFYIVFSNVYFHHLKNNALITYNSIFSQSSVQIIDYFSSIEKASNSLFLNIDFQTDLLEHLNLPSINTRQKINNRLAIYKFYSNIATGATFITSSNTSEIEYYSTFTTIPYNKILETIELIEPVKGHPYSLYIMMVYDDNMQIYDDLLIVRKIMRLSSPFSDLGYGVITINRSSILKMLDNKGTIEGTEYFIIDKLGRIITATNEKYAGQQLSSIMDMETEGDVQYNNENFIYKSYKIESIGWEIIAVAPKKILYRSGYEIQQFLFYILLGAVCLSILFTLIINIRFTYPLKRLTEGFRRISLGDMDTKIVFDEKNEITTIADSFNKMVENINILTKRNMETQKMLYEEALEKRQFELSGLQSQINSHFLYNTLNTIRGMVMKSEIDAAIDNLEKLINFLRYSSNNDIYVTIKDEVEHLGNYLSIQNARFNNRFKLLINVEEELLTQKILKLTLQPLIENSIKHAFLEPSCIGLMQLSVKKQGADIDIRLFDNGVGMSPARLKEMKAQLAKKIDFKQRDQNGLKPGNIGLINIHRRLQIFYSDQYGLSINSWENRGTAVHIRMPAETPKCYITKGE